MCNFEVAYKCLFVTMLTKIISSNTFKLYIQFCNMISKDNSLKEKTNLAPSKMAKSAIGNCLRLHYLIKILRVSLSLGARGQSM